MTTPTSCTVVVGTLDATPPDWTKELADTTDCLLVTSRQIHERSVEAVRAGLSPETDLKTQIALVNARIAAAEAEVLRQLGVGTRRVLFFGVPGYYALAVDGWVIDFSRLQPFARPSKPGEDRLVVVRRLAETRHTLAADFRNKGVPERFCYLPSRLSNKDRLSRSIDAMRAWGLL